MTDLGALAFSGFIGLLCLGYGYVKGWEHAKRHVAQSSREGVEGAP